MCESLIQLSQLEQRMKSIKNCLNERNEQRCLRSHKQRNVTAIAFFTTIYLLGQLAGALL